MLAQRQAHQRGRRLLVVWSASAEMGVQDCQVNYCSETENDAMTAHTDEKRIRIIDGERVTQLARVLRWWLDDGRGVQVVIGIYKESDSKLAIVQHVRSAVNARKLDVGKEFGRKTHEQCSR